MKTTFLALFTVVLLVGCTTKEDLPLENNELLEVNSKTIVDATLEKGTNNITKAADDPIDPNQYTVCYDIYFDPAIYTAEEIRILRDDFFQTGYWIVYEEQPANAPYHQIWCKIPGHPGGEESENDPPTGITFVPRGEGNG